MYHRLKLAKPTYSSKKLEDEYKYSKYMEQLHKGSQINPCMFFDTAEQYQKSLYATARSGFNSENQIGKSSSNGFYKNKNFTSTNKFRASTAVGSNGFSSGFNKDYGKINMSDFENAKWIKGSLGLSENRNEFIPNSAVYNKKIAY